MPRAAAAILCGLGIVMIVGGLRQSRHGRETRAFTRTSGRVVAAHVEETPAPSEEGGPWFRPIVRYAYEARGRTYESGRISAGGTAETPSHDPREARRWVERYRAGGEVEVWFDPRDPGRSVLVRDVPRAQVVVAIGLGLALLAAGLLSLAR